MIEYTADDEINVRARQQAFGRCDLNLGTDEANLEAWLLVFHCAGHAQIAKETYGGSEQNHEFVVLCDAANFFRCNVVRRPVQQTAPFEHSCRLSQPNWIPVRLNFACGGPTRARAAIELFKAR